MASGIYDRSEVMLSRLIASIMASGICDRNEVMLSDIGMNAAAMSMEVGFP